jgi:hypothetical protein
MVRRIVTANNAQGRSFFLSDDTLAEMYIWQSPEGAQLGEDTPVLPSTAPGIEPPAGGSKVVRVQMEPWKEMKERLARGVISGLDADGFHRTATIDYIMVVGG